MLKDLNINIMDFKTRTFSTSDRRMISVHVKSEFDEIVMEEVKKGLKAGGAIFTGELTADGAGKTAFIKYILGRI